MITKIKAYHSHLEWIKRAFTNYDCYTKGKDQEYLRLNHHTIGWVEYKNSIATCLDPEDIHLHYAITSFRQLWLWRRKPSMRPSQLYSDASMMYETVIVKFEGFIVLELKNAVIEGLRRQSHIWREPVTSLQYRIGYENPVSKGKVGPYWLQLSSRART